MRLLRFGAIVAVCLLSTAWAQTHTFFDTLKYPQTYSFDFKGDGARAAGMGNAYMAVSDDITAGSWNPAGLYSIELVTLGKSLVNFRPGGSGSGELTFRSLAKSQSEAFNQSGSFTGDFQLFRLVAPLRIKGHPFVFSFGHNRTFEDYQEANYKTSYDQVFAQWIFTSYYEDTNSIDISIRSKTHTKVNSVNFAFGTRLYNNLSGGFALNVFGGSSYRDESQSAFIHDFRLPTGLAYQFSDISRDVSHTDTTRFSGYNVTIGLKYTQPQWTAALVLKTPFSMSAKLDSLRYTVTSIVNKNGVYFPIDNGSDTIMAPRSLTKYDIPMSLTYGVSYKANENTLLAADVEFRKWEGKNVRVRIVEVLNPGSDNEETFVEVDPHWQNVVNFRIGAERMFETGIGKIPLRLGFGTTGMPAPNAELVIDTNTASVAYSSARMSSVSLGFGVHWSQIHLDWAVVRSSVDRTTFREMGPDLALNRDVNVAFGKLESENNSTSIFFTFTGVF